MKDRAARRQGSSGPQARPSPSLSPRCRAASQSGPCCQSPLCNASSREPFLPTGLCPSSGTCNASGRRRTFLECLAGRLCGLPAKTDGCAWPPNQITQNSLLSSSNAGAWEPVAAEAELRHPLCSPLPMICVWAFSSFSHLLLLPCSASWPLPGGA